MSDIIEKRKIGEILVESGCLSPENLAEALITQKKEGGMIGQVLIRLGYVDEESVISAIGKQLHVPYLPLSHYSINMDAAASLGEDFCRRHMMIVFDQDEKKIFLSVADPLNETGVEEAVKITKLKPQIFVSTSSEIFAMIDLIFRNTKKDLKKAG